MSGKKEKEKRRMEAARKSAAMLERYLNAVWCGREDEWCNPPIPKGRLERLMQREPEERNSSG